MLVANSLSFYLSKNDSILTYFWDILAGYRILGWQLFTCIDGFIPLAFGFLCYFLCYYWEISYCLVATTLKIIFSLVDFKILSVFGLLKPHDESRCIFHFIFHDSYSCTCGFISLICSEKFWVIISLNIIFIQALLSSAFRGLIKWMLHLFILFFISPNLSL